METRLDRQRANEQERAQRIKNMQELDEQLQEASDVLAVITGEGYEADQERRTVQAHIEELQSLFDGEKEAYELTYADSKTAADITEKMGL